MEVDSKGKKAGKGALIQTELSGTLGVSQDQTLITNKCLNGWDVQSKHMQPESGKAEALYSGECRYGGGESYVMQNKVYGISAYESNAMKSANPNSGIYEADTSRTLDNNGGNPACNQGGMIVLGVSQDQTLIEMQKAVCIGNGQLHNMSMSTVCNCIDTMHDQQAVLTYGLDRASFNQGENAQYNFSVEEEKAQTIVAKGPGAVLTTQ